ncbi:hypothetical protein PHMEG_00016670 [Phytophthora megakarya]|uniref:Reverse transcriptase domain-containing protein n=1 Tax=Phytophthora megakarya TaxID=4795 RepID=A0A225W0A7_9STRA|nr:hypothetical protein PHMEG_00016670 [Phytophthora megakarya]
MSSVKAGGANEYHQTTDYKPTNAQVEPIAGTMPNLDVDRWLGGYWQLPLDVASQEILSYMTHEKFNTPRRKDIVVWIDDLLLYTKDADALYFQATMELWIDDLLLYTKDADAYLDKLKGVFSVVNIFGFKLSPTKSKSTARIDTLRALPYPSTAGELQQFICSINWMRTSIIDYARLVRPLQGKFDSVTEHTSKQTKRITSGI